MTDEALLEEIDETLAFWRAMFIERRAIPGVVIGVQTEGAQKGRPIVMASRMLNDEQDRVLELLRIVAKLGAEKRYDVEDVP